MVKASYGLNGERAAGDTLVLSLCSISIVYEAVRLGYRRTKKDGLMVEIAKQEDELRREFYESYLLRVNRELSIDNVLTDYSDGILNGNIIEFKEYVSDLNNVLLQALKYLSARRIKGKPIPANILLISLKNKKAWLYHSEEYLNVIETPFVGGASKGNGGFVIQDYYRLFEYDKPLDENGLIETMRSDNYTKIHLDENCIVGWATHYYELNPSARKADFIGDNTGKTRIIGEIRKPTEEETVLLNLWKTILLQAKNTKDYDSTRTYGLYQVKVELNSCFKDELTGETRFDYPELQGNILALAKRVKDYYLKEIVPILFKYKFLK